MSLIGSRSRLQWLALVAAMTAWLPVVLLSVARSYALPVDDVELRRDQISLMMRNLVCIPLLVLAYGMTMPRLWSIANNFVAADIVGDRGRFDMAMARAGRMMDARAAMVASVLLAYAVSGSLAWYARSGPLLPWQRSDGSLAGFSLAGWWHVLVSLPVLLALLINWIWRASVWYVLLWRIAHSGLRLVASHPDGNAGIGFIGASVRAFTPVAVAFSAIAAGRSAQLVARGAALQLPETSFDASFVIAIALFFVGPLSAFAPRLILVGRQGAMRYGTLAYRAGQAFEQRWLPPDGRVMDDAAFERRDFSALIDLYSVVTIARSVKFLPVSRRQLASFILWLIVPFFPALLMTVPLPTLLTKLKGLLL